MDIYNTGLYIEDQQLSAFAASAARLLPVKGSCRGRNAAAELRRSCAVISRCRDDVSRRFSDSPDPPPACEWLLDNWYMVKREYLVAASEFKSAPELRRCGEGCLVTELCRSLLSAGQGRISEKRCAIYLEGFQKTLILKRSELALFPAAMRCAILDAIAAVCRDMQYAADTSRHAEAFSALFSSLRLLSVLDTEKLLRSADVCDAVFLRDPTGDYGKMDGDTRREYLRRLSVLAKRLGVEEHVLAERLVANAEREHKHLGFYLFDPPGRTREALYISLNILLTLFFSLLIAFRFDSIPAAVGLLLPVSELVKNFLDCVLLRIVPPRPLPRMDMKDGIPPEGRTICVISTIVGGCGAERLEELRLGARTEGRVLSFGLLADLPAAKKPVTAEDAAALQQLKCAVDSLNRKYGGGFYLFTRERCFDGEAYCGRERKRGAVTELAKLLCGMDSELHVFGDRDALAGTRYIITLDSDTRVYPGALGQLVGAALHPLCKPIVDAERKTVLSGHAILHPRIETDLTSAGATDFSLVFAPAGGCDPYGGICSELYMDAFESGGFTGKGLIDARAYLDCTLDRFPAGRILSHDALEGAYLRGGFMGDCSFSDEFPTKPLPYFKRLHRWTRGDWQNLPFLFKRELRPIDRFRLTDSLRRSLLAPATFIAITVGFFCPERGLTVAAWAALLSLLSDLFISLARRSMSRRTRPRLRRYTRVLSGVGGAIVRSFMRLWLLPYEALICFSAAVTALWRMGISRRRLLQWQTAAQSERGGDDLAAHIKAMWFPVMTGVILMAFAPAIIGKAAGFLWLLSPVTAAALALPAYRESALRGEDREYIRSAAAANWRYLSEFSSQEEHYLPPDNFQEQPPVGVAHRTSPTNIGLAMAAAVAVADMEIITAAQAVEYISRVTDTLEKLPRYAGHFFNWYDTGTLLPLHPVYISTVDSGNLCAGLITVRSALLEWGEKELASRLEKLTADMDFSLLYDESRNLFYICYDTANHRGAGGWYDLMASEAMLTSYLAIAKGDVPVRHWRRLSRAQLQKDGYRGLASWTGTMFEYLMPELFLPLYRSSLLYESLRLCVYAQRKRAFAGKPWGISESAFYSLDAALNYRYKAHGCPALALRRGMEQDMVISPYSSFLALAVEAQNSVRNLRRLERFGAVGRYGFMEALDFTPGRCRSERGEKVRCYMAHHVSMSILSAANAVCAGSVRRRFMADPSMRSHTLFLQEKLPDSALVIRRDLSEVPEKPPRNSQSRWEIRGRAEDTRLTCCALSNGAYNIMLTSRGHSSGTLGNICVYSGSTSAAGVRLALGDTELMPSAGLEEWELSEERGKFRTVTDAFDCTASISTAGGDCGEYRRVELTARGELDLPLSLSFRPILAEYIDYVNHPAYWQLGMEAEYAPDALLIHRLPGRGDAELWLCMRCSEKMTPSCADGQALETVTLRCGVKLRAGERRSVSFALCVSRDKQEALEGAERILLSEGSSPGCMAGAAAVHLGMSPGETGAAMDMVKALWENPVSAAAPRADLWQYGISGTLPLICCDSRAQESDRLLRRFCLLKSCGVNAELVYLSDEQGEYLQPMLRRISRTLSSVGLEALIGSPGGVFTVPLSAAPLIQSRAAIVIGEPPKELRPVHSAVAGEERKPRTVPEYHWTQEGFEYYVNRDLPSRVWQHILTNGSFGYVATDAGTGFLFWGNAREMRIDLPPEDVRAVKGSESISLSYKEQSVSLFAANDGFPCRVLYAPGEAVWEKMIGERRVRTTAFIPAGIDARVLIIDGAQGMKLRWCLAPVMGAPDAASVQCSVALDHVTFTDPESYIKDAEFTMACSGAPRIAADFVPAAAELTVLCHEHTVLVCGCAPLSEIQELCKLERAPLLREAAKQRWQSILGRFTMDSGIERIDRYMNGWSAYQCIAGRMEGRTSLYQSGGAVGFRDQLQDAVNMLLVSPDYARRQILECCRHQYVEGDVMHWWHAHPDGDRGVRTRCSDDMLWLVWALCEYTDATGDYDLCRQELRYITSPLLKAGERDRYETPAPSEAVSSVLDHAKASLECCISRGFGAHGLPYMGSGDWNDALSAVDGESVWLGWFFSCCAQRFAGLLDKLCKPDGARYRDYAAAVGKAADRCRQDHHYVRGYYADGEILGGGERIDSVVQSWAALNPYADRQMADRALTVALCKLVDREHQLVKIFTPPYTVSERSPGYITGYGRGFRENGGQYTHAAIWLAMAAFALDRPEDGLEILQLLAPGRHDSETYEAEPFVLPADISSAPGHEGEAGWTWYTGSAGWYFRAVTEHLLGLKLRGGKLYIEPSLPACMDGYTVRWVSPRGSKHEITLRRGIIQVDGKAYHGEGIE